ncbi:hypothetical protein FISHEDRAFT_75558 [Fistulina hepatica ATCC 64428]|uniref:Uncharacterized protein n=1 Tax=Fistulina hepatica ATCC 64428 TaxID=1128425 RepID=A0A0D7A691_9AGAR|nr:hypothetical protein FISHEDRAFT_75558 [Fistulina hepatica ATCC 64428]
MEYLRRILPQWPPQLLDADETQMRRPDAWRRKRMLSIPVLPDATENLRLYVRQAHLPLPPILHGARHEAGTLARIESYRYLKHVIPLDNTEFEASMDNWMRLYVPLDPIKAPMYDEATGLGLMLPCVYAQHAVEDANGAFICPNRLKYASAYDPDVPGPAQIIPESEREGTTNVGKFLAIATNIAESFVVRTAMYALALSCPDEMRRFQFGTIHVPSAGETGSSLNGTENSDRSFSSVINMAIWAPQIPAYAYARQVRELQSRAVLIVTVALQDSEIANLAHAGKAPQCPSETTACHEVLAKVWDACLSLNCFYFVINNGGSWFFGYFVPDRRYAMIRDAIRHSSFEPSVVSAMMFWMACAAKLEGCMSYRDHQPAMPCVNPWLLQHAGVMDCGTASYWAATYTHNPNYAAEPF